MVAIAMVASAVTPALAQLTPPNNPVPPAIVTRGSPTLTPLGWYAAGSIVCAAVSPMIGTAILGRELTIGEAHHTTLTACWGRVGFWLMHCSRQRHRSDATGHVAAFAASPCAGAISTFHRQAMTRFRSQRSAAGIFAGVDADAQRARDPIRN
jgi:hypothetical protein